MSEPSASVLSRIRELLGLGADDVPSVPPLEDMLRRTRRQLLECARYLGLTGIHRLTKDALATRFLEALQALAGPAEAPEPAEPPAAPVGRIPWGYGQDHVTAMVVDPERLYVYWEVTDEAIERARRGLGPGGPDAWLDLRVYDVTDRIFDGTNAHGYFDHGVSRSDRQWFFSIGRPGSTAIVELGLKSPEGYFVRIARSGRADFPRVEPAPAGGVEWLTVRAATGEVGAPSPDTHPPPAFSGGVDLPTAEPVRVWDIRRTHGAWIVRDESFGSEWTAIEWGEHRIEWEGPVVHTSWEAGPFPYPVAPPASVEERHGGAVVVRSVNGGTHVVYGPWHVVIRGLGARAERRILAVWEVHRSWTAPASMAREIAARTGRAPGASEGVLLGASERRWRAASELRLGGASELYRLGASELRFLGASEWRYGVASEIRHAGASERLRDEPGGEPPPW